MSRQEGKSWALEQMLRAYTLAHPNATVMRLSAHGARIEKPAIGVTVVTDEKPTEEFYWPACYEARAQEIASQALREHERQCHTRAEPDKHESNSVYFEIGEYVEDVARAMTEHEGKRISGLVQLSGSKGWLLTLEDPQ